MPGTGVGSPQFSWASNPYVASVKVRPHPGFAAESCVLDRRLMHPCISGHPCGPADHGQLGWTPATLARRQPRGSRRLIRSPGNARALPEPAWPAPCPCRASPLRTVPAPGNTRPMVLPGAGDPEPRPSDLRGPRVGEPPRNGEPPRDGELPRNGEPPGAAPWPPLPPAGDGPRDAAPPRFWTAPPRPAWTPPRDARASPLGRRGPEADRLGPHGAVGLEARRSTSDGIVRRSSDWMSRRSGASSTHTSEIAWPSVPARPVRPMRWM